MQASDLQQHFHNRPLQARPATVSKWLCFVAFFGVLAALHAPLGHTQTEEEKTRQQLEQLESDIERISADVGSSNIKRDKLQRELKKAEVDIGEVKRDIGRTKAEITAAQTELSALQVKQSELQQSLQSEKDRMAREMRAAWRVGGQGELKLILNQENPNDLARMLAYYRHVFSARDDLLKDYRATLAGIEDVTAEIDDVHAQLEKRRERQEKQHLALKKSQEERQETLTKLSLRIDTQSKQLEKLKADRVELEKLIKAIEEAVAELDTPPDYRAFTSARGAMPWPLQGKPSNQFGRSRNAGKMRWQGMTIPADEGTNVRAIHHGRVVYADWLRGSGLLLIIDHGDNYMSLYAHNSSLLKDVGEWVTSGDAVATVGSTGGREKSALYFEIRHNGKPVDPAKWCTN